MLEYVIAEGVLEAFDGADQKFEVVYGFLTLPRPNYDTREAAASISAVVVKSTQGIFIPTGRYRLTSREGEVVILERNNLGWLLIPECKAPEMKDRPKLTIHLLPLQQAQSR
jgi:hypothetical protein